MMLQIFPRIKNEIPYKTKRSNAVIIFMLLRRETSYTTPSVWAPPMKFTLFEHDK